MRGFVKQAVVVFFINIVYLSTYSLVSNDLSAAPKPSKSQTIFSQRNMVFIKVRANSMEEVEKLNAMGIDYKSVGAKTVPVEQSRLEEFAEMGINFEIARKALVFRAEGIPLAKGKGEIKHKLEDTDVPIPDNDSWGVVSEITVWDAPYNAVVTNVDLKIQIVHDWLPDLYVEFYDQWSGNYLELWDGEGDIWDGSDNGYDHDLEDDWDIYLYYYTWGFNGQDVNQTWTLYAEDQAAEDTGYIDYLEIWLYYNEAGGYYCWPLSKCDAPAHELNSAFGPRILISGSDTTFDFHRGLDIDDNDAPGAGEDVYPVFTDTVEYVDINGTYPHVIVKDLIHPNQHMRYTHVIAVSGLSPGDYLISGETHFADIQYLDNRSHLDVKYYIGDYHDTTNAKNPMHTLPYTDTYGMTIWGVSSHWPRAAFWVTVPGNELDLNRVRVYGSGPGWTYDKYVDYDERHNCGDDNPTHDGITITPTDFGGYPPNDQVTGFTLRYDARPEGIQDSSITIEVYNIWGVMEASYSVEVYVEPNEDENLPREFSVAQNFPNPFNPETEISYELPKDAYVTLAVYNLLGQKVKTLVDERQRAARHNIRWGGRDHNGKEVSSGVYFYKIQAEDVKVAKKMVLIR